MSPNEGRVQLLKLARDRLADAYPLHSLGKERFICHALEEAVGRGSSATAQRWAALHYLKSLIDERLEGRKALGVWLGAVCQSPGAPTHEDLKYDRDHNNGRRLQATRLAWVNSMIVEFGGTP